MNAKNLLAWVFLVVLPMSMQGQKEEQNKYRESYNFKRAIEILDADGDQNEALGYLWKEIEQHPKNGFAYSLIGHVYMQNDMPGEAIEPINKAIEIWRKDKALLSAGYLLRARLSLTLNKEDAALSDWESALKYNPKDVDIYSDRAEYYYQRDMYEKSDADFKKICELQPGNTLGFMGVGRNALEQGKYEEATEQFAYCVSLDPSFAKAYAFRAEAKMMRGNTNEAIDDIITALALDGDSKAFYLMQAIGEPEVNTLLAKLKVQQMKEPNEAYWLYCQGVIYERQEKFSKAIDCYKGAIRIAPSDVACDRIARCCETLGDYEMALEYINQAIEQDPNDDSYVSEKADLLYELGRSKEAIEAYDTYIKANPEFYGGYYRRGFLKDNANDVDGAIEDYSMAIVLKPDYTYAYLGRGDKYLQKGETEAAMNDYRMVVALDTTLNEYNCAQFAYLGLGEKEKAKSFMYAILGNSASAGNYYDAACLFARMGEKETAVNFLKNSLEKGYARFAHIRNDDDLDSLRDMESYQALINEYEETYRQEQNKKREAEGLNENRQEYVTEIPFTREGGTCSVKCKINDLPLYFVFDTGASDVSISMVEASFMMKNGYLSKSDVIGSTYFSDAVGNINEGTVINLRKVQFGDLELDNVRASVVKNQKAPLLLGQTVLSRAGKIEIDNEEKVIRVKYMK